jgi:hypothetical protein
MAVAYGKSSQVPEARSDRRKQLISKPKAIRRRHSNQGHHHPSLSRPLLHRLCHRTYNVIATVWQLVDITSLVVSLALPTQGLRSSSCRRHTNQIVVGSTNQSTSDSTDRPRTPKMPCRAFETQSLGLNESVGLKDAVRKGGICRHFTTATHGPAYPPVKRTRMMPCSSEHGVTLFSTEDDHL